MQTAPHTWEQGPGLRLVIVAGGPPREHALPEEGRAITIGRGDACEVVVDHASLSREHARISRKSGAFTIEDLGSRNGTRVGGKLLAKGTPIALQPGELAELGAVLVAVRGMQAEATPAKPSSDMARAYELVELVARAPVSVLLLGETGVGKTVIAEKIHGDSQRKGPFLKLNCAAVPEALLEGELFGYERGAFTGAQTAKEGLIEAATNGTLLLDEIGDMALVTQAKLLHAVEQGAVTRLGATKPRPVDVRFVAATHRDLGQMVATGAFRADLFYRINGMTITIPPLRARPDEVATLAVQFLSQTCAKMQRPAPVLRPEALAALLAYEWPGNLRELRNVMDRAALLAKGGEIDVAALALPAVAARPTPPPSDLRGAIDSFERDRIVEALERSGGNQTAAAELVGLPLRTFVKRLTQFGLTKPRKKT